MFTLNTKETIECFSVNYNNVDKHVMENYILEFKTRKVSYDVYSRVKTIIVLDSHIE